jgi:histidine triad (HIT) family protein
MSTCLFCKIVAGEIPSDKVYEDESVLAFRDIAPQTPAHILVIPKKHIESVAKIDKNDTKVVTSCLEIVAKIAEAEGLVNGFRLISNVGADGGQTVPHLHFHILGGKPLGEGLV